VTTRGKALGGRLVDVGCGSGHTLARVQQRCFGRSSLTGIDLPGEAVRLASKRLPEARFAVHDVERAPLSGTYGVMICLGVAEHLATPCSTLAALRAAIEPGGFLLLEVPNCIAYGRSGSHEGFRRLAGGSRQIEWHLRRGTWERLLGEAGRLMLASMRGYRKSSEFTWFLGSVPPDRELNLRTIHRLCRAARWREYRSLMGDN